MRKGKTKIKKKCNGKSEGASSIFMVIILGSMISLVMAFISVSIRTGAIGYTDGLVNLAARSVLSEFDTHLKDDYGLFAFRGHRAEISGKMDDYLSYTFDRNRYLDLESVDTNTAGYSLADVDIFEDEICEYTKYAIARGWIKEKLTSTGDGEGNRVDITNEGRTLRNHKIIDALPSGAKPGNGSLVDTVKGLMTANGNFLESGSKSYILTQYIMNRFKNAQKQTDEETFFSNEAEYILEGKMSDQENRKAVRRDLRRIRNAIDFAYIWADEKMRSEVMLAAEAMGLEVATPLAAAAIAEAWAYAEAENDMRVLEHGKRVPIYKTRSTWAIDIQSIIEDKDAGYIDSSNGAGLTYQGYLQLLLFAEERALKLGRIMDLIQINIVGRYDDTFLIQEHNMGFYTNVEVDGRKYAYDHKY